MSTHNLQSLIDETDILTHKMRSSVPDDEFLLGLSRTVQSSMIDIIGMLNLALEDNFTESVNECLYSARFSADNLVKIINHITEVYRLESGDIQIDPQNCSLSDILLDVDHQLYDDMVEMGCIFSVTVHEAVPNTIRTDPVRLKECLLALIKNTTRELKSNLVMLGVGSSEGEEGSRITFEIAHVRSCNCTCERSCVCQDYWERVDTVLNWQQGTEPRPDSRDLGLAVAHQLAVLMGGHLSIESSPQEPLHLTLRIPCGTGERSEEVIGEWQPKRSLCPALSTDEETPAYQGRILVGNSDRVDQKRLFTTLKKFGLDVTIAVNGSEVLKRAQEDVYDLLIVDMNMTDMDGCEVTRRLRANSLGTPIVALASNLMKSQIDACLAAGYNEHLPKPIDQAQLVDILSRYLTTSDQSVEPVEV